MKIKFSLLGLSAMFALVFSQSLLAQTTSITVTTLAEVSNQGNFPAVLQPALHNYWSNGYLIATDVPGSIVPDKPGVILYDRYGVVSRQAMVWPDKTRDVSLTDAAISPSGNLVVSGGATNEDGTIGNFILEIGSDDRIKRIVHTTPFVPWYLCALDDGTVWAYGFQRDASMSAAEGAPRLRHYSLEKGQLEALLDPGSLPDAQTSREMWRSIQGRYLGAIHLQCNSKTVAFYNAASGDLFEYDLKKSTLNLTKIAALPDINVFHITGFALTNSGDIFASFYDRSNVKAVVAGLFQLVRDSFGGAKWVAVPGTTGRYRENPPIQKLWGADGDKLVFSRLKDGRLYWTK